MSYLRRLQLYVDTIRYLKFRQIFGRIVFRYSRPKLNLRAAPRLRDAVAVWQKPASRRASMLAAEKLCFLNQVAVIEDVDSWQQGALSKLWLYNMHYFDDLNAVSAHERRNWHCVLINKWIKDNPPLLGIGWEPYPLSLRIVNWIKWALSGNALDGSVLFSLAVQVRHLRQRLEYHLLGNHLFVNAKALVFAGCYFQGEEAEEWLLCGLGILNKEIPEQILSDGGHFERSPMYHALAYEDMLDLVNLSKSYIHPLEGTCVAFNASKGIIEEMGGWLVAMCHPDGEIAFFNDAAIGVAPSPKELFAYSERLGLSMPRASSRVVWLQESGYVRVQQGEAVLIIDVAQLGPDYLPAHGHADTLSYEFSVNGQRLIVNSGTSRYGLGAEREHERSTAAHSTLEINGQNSSEVWGGFRVARRAYPFDVSVREDGEAVIVEAAHNGYQRLSGKPVHRRRWVFNLNSLEVYDWIEGGYKKAVSRIYVHPKVKLDHSETLGDFTWGDKVVKWRVDGAEVDFVATRWHPEFGMSKPNCCLAMNILDVSTAKLCFRMEW